MGAFWAFPGKFPREAASARPQQSSSCKAALLLTNITAEYDAVFTLFLNWPKMELEPFILNPSVVAVTGLFAREIMPFIHPLIWPRYATIWTLYIESESLWLEKTFEIKSDNIFSSLHEGRSCLHPSARQAACTHCFNGDHPSVFLFSCFSPHSANLRLLQLP